MEDSVLVRYWAAARSASGLATEDIPVPGPLSLAELCAVVARRHEGTRLPDVIAICSFLIGDRPVSSTDPDAVLVRPGDTVEFLPPFAGG